jgi:hypothetical protein|tara:strand:+ start:3498 stop:3737 length:240 start_codon:yes stop_codon:yes gene_type:complete
MKRSRNSVYQTRYYRKKTVEALRAKNKLLNEKIKELLDSPEGKAYKNRKSREYYRTYRDKNREKITEYQKEYRNLYEYI